MYGRRLRGAVRLPSRRRTLRRTIGGLALAALLLPPPVGATGNDPPAPPGISSAVRTPPAGQETAPTAPPAQDNSRRLTSLPDSVSSDLEIGGEVTTVAGAVETYRANAAELAAGTSGPETAQLEATQRAIEAALAGRLRAAANELNEPLGFAIDNSTRNLVSQISGPFLGLQVAAATLDPTTPVNAIHRKGYSQIARVLETAARRDSPTRFQFVTSILGHYVGGDVFLDPGRQVMSTVILDSLGSVRFVNGLFGQFEDAVGDEWHSAISYYLTEQQSLCLGCEQFALEFVKEMSARDDIHDRPLARLAARIATNETGDPVRLRDVVEPRNTPSSSDAARLGELPPELFSLTNAPSSLENFTNERQAFLATLSDPERQEKGAAQLTTLANEIATNQRMRARVKTVDGRQATLVKPTNLAVDMRRQTGIAQLAEMFEAEEGGQLLQSDAALRDAVLDTAADAGSRQQKRFTDILTRDEQQPEHAAATPPPAAAHEEVSANPGSTTDIADRVLKDIVADRREGAPDDTQGVAVDPAHGQAQTEDARRQLAALAAALDRRNGPREDADAWPWDVDEDDGAAGDESSDAWDRLLGAPASPVEEPAADRTEGRNAEFAP